jgi:hypothetical protein
MNNGLAFVSGAVCMLVLLAAFVKVRKPWR